MQINCKRQRDGSMSCLPFILYSCFLSKSVRLYFLKLRLICSTDGLKLLYYALWAYPFSEFPSVAAETRLYFLYDWFYSVFFVRLHHSPATAFQILRKAQYRQSVCWNIPEAVLCRPQSNPHFSLYSVRIDIYFSLSSSFSKIFCLFIPRSMIWYLPLSLISLAALGILSPYFTAYREER